MEKQKANFKPLRFKKVNRQNYIIFLFCIPFHFGSRKNARVFYQQKKIELKRRGVLQ
jgi:hypothetical protein